MAIGSYFKVDKILLLMFAVAIMLWAFNVTHSLTHFSHDNHEAYIIKIDMTGAIPSLRDCHECYQPPLYYLIGAKALKLAKICGVNNPWVAVRGISFLFYVLYAYFASRILKENLSWRLAYLVALSIVLFLPLGFNMAVIINNDVPSFALQTAALYYVLRWWKSMRRGDLCKALLCTAIAINFKVSAVIILAVIGIFVIAKYWKTSFSLASLLKNSMTYMVILAVALAALPVIRNNHYSLAIPDRTPNMTGRITSHRVLLIPVNKVHFLSFNIAEYISQPFYLTGEDGGGRTSFWNAVFKTALFDEFEWRSASLALALSGLQLAMIYYGIISFVSIGIQRKAIPWNAPLTVCCIYIAALAAYVIYSPVACSQEYRYIFAITPLCALLYAKAIQWQKVQNNIFMARAGISMGALFAIISIAFIIIEFWPHLSDLVL